MCLEHAIWSSTYKTFNVVWKNAFAFACFALFVCVGNDYTKFYSKTLQKDQTNVER